MTSCLAFIYVIAWLALITHFSVYGTIRAVKTVLGIAFVEVHDEIRIEYICILTVPDLNVEGMNILSPISLIACTLRFNPESRFTCINIY